LHVSEQNFGRNANQQSCLGIMQRCRQMLQRQLTLTRLLEAIEFRERSVTELRNSDDEDDFIE
jgi:hypothetical protein